MTLLGRFHILVTLFKISLVRSATRPLASSLRRRTLAAASAPATFRCLPFGIRSVSNDDGLAVPALFSTQAEPRDSSQEEWALVKHANGELLLDGSYERSLNHASRLKKNHIAVSSREGDDKRAATVETATSSFLSKNTIYWKSPLVASSQYKAALKSFAYPKSQPFSFQRRRIVSLSVRGGGREWSASAKAPPRTKGTRATLRSPLYKKDQRVSALTTQVTNDEELPRVVNRYPVTGCAAIGWRPYMEDEALIQSDLVAVFDGHGGASVSRYVRQNLYGHIQAILPRVLEERHQSLHKQQEEEVEIQENIGSTDKLKTTPEDYQSTLRLALEKVNKEVMRIIHWSYQGSTAVVCWLHETMAVSDDEAAESGEQDGQPVRTLVAANIGDSRLVLSRNGQAIPLSRDHKPDDPIELAYVQSQGGKVTYPSGVPRVNGVMALSRAIGDRSETPCIRAEPDLIVETLSAHDEFYVLATDGLWDVMTNQDVVTFLHQCFQGDLSDDSRQELTKQLVLEALERGAEDNITVLVVWLQ